MMSMLFKAFSVKLIRPNPITRIHLGKKLNNVVEVSKFFFTEES